MRSVCFAVAAAAALGCSSPAWALLATDGGNHLLTPTNRTSFETFVASTFPANTAFIDDGIVVELVSPTGQGVVVTDNPNTGENGWSSTGIAAYTSIRMANGSLMDEIQWAAQGCCQAVIHYEVYRQGQLLAPRNHFSAIGGPYRNFGLGQIGSSELFDEVRLVVTFDPFVPFSPNAFQALTMDDLSVHGLDPPTSDAVPEPAAWAMMLMGFGAIGLSERRLAKARRMAGLAASAPGTRQA